MRYDIKNAESVLLEDGAIDGYQCLVKPEIYPFWIPFYAKEDDSEEHGRGIFAAIQAGESFYIQPDIESEGV